MSRKPKTIRIQSCIDILHRSFQKITDPRKGFKAITLHDFFMSSYAIFALKYPSLLSFQNDMKVDIKFKNLRTLFGIAKVPSDTHLRDVMDQVKWEEFRGVFKRLFSLVQHSKILEKFEFIKIKNRPHYLVNIDGTGYFRSDKVGCDCCLTYKGSEDRKLPQFGHNMLGASLPLPLLEVYFSPRFLRFM